jgi:5-formyltetrahydrofolate cyclo-ligase
MIRDKKVIRGEYIKKRLALTEKEVSLKSMQIFQKIEEVDGLFEKKSFGVYFAIKNEVEVKNLIDKLVSQKKEVHLPKFFEAEKAYFFGKFSGWNEIEAGYYGIMQPKSNKKADVKNIDVIFVPGVAFDKKGVRLGWGTGTYDQLLKGSKAIKIGLAYDFQVADSLPYEEHDIKVDMIVTEKRVVEVSSV